MDVIEVKDTLRTALDYMDNLKLLNNELKIAQQQIITSSQEAECTVQNLFDTLYETIKKTLMERCNQLIAETNNVKNKYIKPLKECQSVIQERINETESLITLGECIVKSKTTANLEEFHGKSAFLGTLPEVPQLKDVPFISFQYDKNIDKEFVDICQNIGHISYIGPIQINTIVENPGGLLIQWQTICDLEEKFGDIKEYHLQIAYGDSTKTKNINYNTCYKGQDTQYLVKDLQLNQPYSFRISCKFESSTDWSPWSIPQVGSTKLNPYCWKNNDDYLLSNENRIAKPLKDNPSVLYSNGPQLKEGFSIEFTFLDADENLDVYVGLIQDPTFKEISSSNFLQNESCKSLLLKATGDIYLNSSKKSTKLPKITAGSKVNFTYESSSDGKTRINIDSDDKRVTYDWTLFMDNEINNFYFVALFSTSKWKIMVE